MSLRSLVVLGGALLSAAIACAKGLPTLPQESLVPGGVAFVRVDTSSAVAPRVKLEGKPVMVLREDDHWLAVVGIPLATRPGKLALAIELPDARAKSAELTIKPK